MSKKRKKKKGKLPTGVGDGDWVTAGLDTSCSEVTITQPPFGGKTVEASAPGAASGKEQETAWSGETKNTVAMSASEGIRLEAASKEIQELPSEIGPERIGLQEEEYGPMARKPGDKFFQEQEVVPEPRPTGLWGKVARFFRGSSKSSPFEAPPAETPTTSPFAFPLPGGKAPDPTLAVKKRQGPGTAIGEPEPQRPPQPAAAASAADHVHAILTLERVLPELEAARQQLQEEKESAQFRIQQLEAERDQSRAAADRARAERNEIEAHTAILRKSVAALDRQLQEERGAAATRIEELVAEQDRIRSEQSPLQSRIQSLEGELQAARSAVSQSAAELEAGRTQRDRLESLLERLRGEMETLQRQLQEEKEKGKERIQELEAELTRRRGASEQARAGRSRFEERAGLVQKALEILEQQLREERETAAAQMRQLEEERKQARAKCAELEARLRSLGEELQEAQRRRKKKDAAGPAAAELEAELEETRTHATRVESRLQGLENEPITAQHQVLQEKQTATTRIQRLESKWDELKSRLHPKDQELNSLRQQTEEFRAQIRQLETSLAQAQEHSHQLQRELSERKALLASARASQMSATPHPTAGATASATTESGKSSAPLPPQIAEPLYHQAMVPLTVLLASADIVLMNPKLDPRLRETAQEIKTQGQTLLDIIKSFTLPPDSPKSN